MSFDGNDVEAVRKDRQFGFVGIGNELPLEGEDPDDRLSLIIGICGDGINILLG